MAVENLPHWTIKPNWRSPLAETYSWLTGLLRSESGAEQRFGLRQSPRRFLEPLMTPIGSARALFDLSVGKVGADPWYVPLWHDVGLLTATVSASATTIPVVTEDRQFEVGGFVMLRGSDFESEVLEVTSVSATEIEVADGPDASWPAGAEIYPCVKARLTEQPSMNRIVNRVVESALRFEVVGTNDYTPTAATTTYLGLPVLTTPPDESVSSSHGYERIFDRQDNSTGIAEVIHSSLLGLTTQGHSWLCATRAERNALREFFYSLEGRCNPLWLPTFAEDLTLAEDVESADTSLVVFRCGFTDYGGPREGREDVIIFRRDAAPIIRRVTGSSLNMDGTENVVLSAAVGADVAMGDVQQICFLSLNRLDGDDVNFEHYAAGVCRVSANFRSAPDVRSASAVDVEILPNTAMTLGACGECTPALTPSGSRVLINADGGSFARAYPTGGGGLAVSYRNWLNSRPMIQRITAADSVSSPVELIGTIDSTTLNGGVPTVPVVPDTTNGDLHVYYSTTVTGVTTSYKKTFDADLALLTGPTTIGTGVHVVGAAADNDNYRTYLMRSSLFVNVTTDRIATDGTPPGAVSVSLADSGSGSRLLPFIVRDTAGGNVLIGWRDNDDTGRLKFIVYDEDLAPISGTVNVSSGAAAVETFCGAVYSGGSFYVVWKVFTSATTFETRVRQISTSGVAGTQSVLATSTEVPGFGGEYDFEPAIGGASAAGLCTLLVPGWNHQVLPGSIERRVTVIRGYRISDMSLAFEEVVTLDTDYPSGYVDTFYTISATQLGDGSIAVVYSVYDESVFNEPMYLQRYALTECC